MNKSANELPATSLRPKGRLIAIGDIHGHAKALEGLLVRIELQPDDTIVTLGDYVNRGPQSREVLESLSQLSDHCRHIPILGNHDEMMLESRDDKNAESRWCYSGGEETLLSYGYPADIQNIPKTHWEFLASCLPFWETDQFIFTHANYCPHLDFADQHSSDLRWLSLEDQPPQRHQSGKTIVVGHTPGEVRDYGFCIGLDTGCGFGGLLTAMDLDKREIWQVNEAGCAVK